MLARRASPPFARREGLGVGSAPKKLHKRLIIIEVIHIAYVDNFSFFSKKILRQNLSTASMWITL